jgi:hypothetical protein
MPTSQAIAPSGTHTPWDVAKAAIQVLPHSAARAMAVDILLTEPETLGDDVLESCLYLLRERLSAP